MDPDTLKWVAIMITFVLIMYIIYILLNYLRNSSENFVGASIYNYDIAGYLAQREIYDKFYNGGGAELCRSATAMSEETELCGSGGGSIGSAYTYSPPLLVKEAEAEADIVSQFAAAKIQVDQGIQLEYPKFILYTNKPLKPSFELGSNFGNKTPFENYLDSITRLTVSSDGFNTYKTYIKIDYKLYEFGKIYSPAQANILGVIKQDERSATPIKLYVAVGQTQLPYEQLVGADGSEPSADLLKPLLKANSQAELTKLIKESAFASANGRSATGVAGSASASTSAVAAPVNRQILQLPLQTYITDGWIANKSLFDEMSSSSVTAARSYASAAGIANTSDTYINTVRKFIELDKRILAGGAAGAQLKAPNGRSYKFKVPNAYEPSLQSFSGDYETPADQGTAVDFKCYALKQDEVDAISYFSRRNYESADMPNKEISEQIRKNICASYGYYSSSAVGDTGCNCNGCCIPIAYKAKQSGLGLGGQAQFGQARTLVASPAMQVQQALDYTSDSLELLGKTDKCVHLAQPFQIKRSGPVFRKTPTCGMETREGFIALPENYGLMNAAIKQQVARTARKGDRFFGATGFGAGIIA